MKRYILLLSVIIPASIGIAKAEIIYNPSFPCPRPDNSDLLASKVCDSSDMAKADLILNQTYYALRWQDGPSGYQSLKEQAIKANVGLRDICGIPQVGSSNPLPDNVQYCYIQEQTSITNQWRSQLSPPALEEASRNIDQHISLQQKLIDAGYVGGTADGIYGDMVRDGIVRWQKAHDIEPNGFLTNKMASLLQGDAVQPASSTTASTDQSNKPSTSSNDPKKPAISDIMNGIHNAAIDPLPQPTEPTQTETNSPADNHTSSITETQESRQSDHFGNMLVVIFGVLVILTPVAWMIGMYEVISSGNIVMFILYIIFPFWPIVAGFITICKWFFSNK